MYLASEPLNGRPPRCATELRFILSSLTIKRYCTARPRPLEESLRVFLCVHASGPRSLLHAHLDSSNHIVLEIFMPHFTLIVSRFSNPDLIDSYNYAMRHSMSVMSSRKRNNMKEAIFKFLDFHDPYSWYSCTFNKSAPMASLCCYYELSSYSRHIRMDR